MTKNNLLKSLNKIKSSKGVDPTKIEITPFRDWRIIIIVFFVGIVISISLNMYMLTKISSDSFFTIETKNEDVIRFKKEGLDQAINLLTEKEALFEEAKIENITVIDPSL